MKTTSLAEIVSEPNPLNVHEIRKPLSKVLGTTDVAINYFELETGESFSGGLHTHHDQEEIFIILEGTATFEIGQSGDETVTVDESEAIRFEPGEYQCGHNHDDATVRAFAIGAPGASHDWDGLETIIYCSSCEEQTGHNVALEGSAFSLTCKACGHEP